MKNNCYKCPFRGSVPGSVHTRCNHPVVASCGEQVLKGIVTGREPFLTNGEGQTVLEFDKHGVRMGWCLWPINFDPTWVDCELEIPNQ